MIFAINTHKLSACSARQSAERHLDKDEIIHVHEVECEEALDMIRRGDIQDAESITGLFPALDWLKEFNSWVGK